MRLNAFPSVQLKVLQKRICTTSLIKELKFQSDLYMSFQLLLSLRKGKNRMLAKHTATDA